MIDSSYLISSAFSDKLTYLLFENVEQLLEVTARAIQPVLDWGESGQSVADGLTNLLKVILFARLGSNWGTIRLSKSHTIFLNFTLALDDDKTNLVYSIN